VEKQFVREDGKSSHFRRFRKTKWSKCRGKKEGEKMVLVKNILAIVVALIAILSVIEGIRIVKEIDTIAGLMVVVASIGLGAFSYFIFIVE